MSPIVIYICIALIVLLVIALIIYFSLAHAQSETVSEEALRNLILSQRQHKKEFSNSKEKIVRGEAAIAASKAANLRRETKDIHRATLSQKLVFADWSITARQFQIMKYALSAIVVAGVSLVLEWPLIATIAFLFPKLVDAVLERSLNKRFNNFDKDFPDFLMTLVSRLRSGMNIMQAMQAASKDLPRSSILKTEVELMVERIKVGYQEEKAISVFAETVPHSEIELFTQVVVLNKKVGGNFAATLERMARQVRLRQEFRRKAISAVTEQKGGAMMVFLIMAALLGAVAFMSPELIKANFTTQMGRVISQFGASMSIFGFYVIKRITTLKI